MYRHILLFLSIISWALFTVDASAQTKTFTIPIDGKSPYYDRFKNFTKQSELSFAVIAIDWKNPQFAEIPRIVARGFNDKTRQLKPDVIGRFISAQEVKNGKSTVVLLGPNKSKRERFVYGIAALEPGHYVIENQSRSVLDRNLKITRLEHRFSKKSVAFKAEPGQLHYLGEYTLDREDGLHPAFTVNGTKTFHNGLSFKRFSNKRLKKFLSEFENIHVEAQKLEGREVGFTCTGRPKNLVGTICGEGQVHSGPLE